MKLKEIKGISHYLENDCYCTGEIYDRTGFFYDVYTGEEDCSLLGERGYAKIILCKNQILSVAIKEDKVLDVTRLDATENNIKQFKKFLDGGSPELILDEFKKGETKKSLDGIMAIADAIMID